MPEMIDYLAEFDLFLILTFYLPIVKISKCTKESAKFGTFVHSIRIYEKLFQSFPHKMVAFPYFF